MKSEPGFWDESWRDNALEIGIEAANGLAFVFEDKGKIVGFACAQDLGFRAYLSELIINRKYRNKGIGKGLWLVRPGCGVDEEKFSINQPPTKHLRGTGKSRAVFERHCFNRVFWPFHML
jgi:hypothetical protein